MSAVANESERKSSRLMHSYGTLNAENITRTLPARAADGGSLLDSILRGAPKNQNFLLPFIT